MTGPGADRPDDATEPSVLVVDGANVVGSRPDGWWRDRPGAARALHDRLVAADAAYDVVLVLEGAARAGVPAGREGHVLTVHAAGHGDDTIAAEARSAADAGHRVSVVTADRELRARVTADGATVVGPSWLHHRI